MAEVTLDRSSAELTLAQHRAAHARVRDVLGWVELCPPNPAETPDGQASIDRWRSGLVERLDTLDEFLRDHIQYEESTELFVEKNPAWQRYANELTHLKAEHAFLLAALERVRQEAGPKLVNALLDDTHEFLRIFERHERAENRIIAEVYGAKP